MTGSLGPQDGKVQMRGRWPALLHCTQPGVEVVQVTTAHQIFTCLYGHLSEGDCSCEEAP